MPRTEMPGLKGLDLAREVRDLGTEVAVILITGGTMPTDEELHDLNVFSVLTKPFKMEELCRCMEEALERESLRLGLLLLAR